MSRPKKKGFTLVELVVVLVIMTVILGIAIPSVLHYMKMAEFRKNEENAKTVYLAAESKLTYYRSSGQWEEFKKRISDGKEEDEDMTLDTFKELMKEYRAELQDNDCGTWSKEAREWAISNGLINGTGTEVNGEPNYAWADQLTREQAAALFYRFAKLMGKA